MCIYINIYARPSPPRSIWEAFSPPDFSKILGILVLEVALLHINSFQNPIENQTEILETWNPGILVLEVALVYIYIYIPLEIRFRIKEKPRNPGILVLKVALLYTNCCKALLEKKATSNLGIPEF